MKTKSKELSVVCLSHLMPNINNTHHYYLASFAVAAKRKIMVIDEMYYLMREERELRMQRLLLMGRKTEVDYNAILDNCPIRINLNKNT